MKSLDNRDNDVFSFVKSIFELSAALPLWDYRWLFLSWVRTIPGAQRDQECKTKQRQST